MFTHNKQNAIAEDLAVITSTQVHEYILPHYHKVMHAIWDREVEWGGGQSGRASGDKVYVPSKLYF